jgi:tetratricopeptide (TPR) repeat protein
MSGLQGGDGLASPLSQEWVVRGIQSPLVGRTRELEELEETLERAELYGTPQTVTIVGNPGIGKTRLVSELIRHLGTTKPTVRAFRGQSREGAPPYSVFGRILKSRFGIVDGASSRLVHERFQQQISELLKDERVDEFVHFLGFFLGLQFPDNPFIRTIEEDPEQRQELTRMVLKRFFELDAEAGPVVLTFEDLQWAHSTSLELVRFLSERLEGAPILVVCVTTPELFVRAPDWFEGESDHARMELPPLNRHDSEQLVSNLVAKVDDPPDELIEAACDMAGGNPFFLEQVVRIFVENGTIEVGDDDQWLVHLEHLETTQLPLTVEDAIQARIGALTPAERNVLEQASVVGSVFWLGALVVLGRLGREPPDLWGGSGDLEPHLRDLLDGLVERDYLMPMPDSTFVGEREYAFKHNLEREMVRRMVSPASARKYHGLLAQWLECRIPDESEEFLELLALNYEKGGEALTAGRFYLQAARSARERYANRKAAEFFKKSLDLLGNGDSIRRVDALHDFGDVLQRTGALDDALAAFEEMLHLAWSMDLRTKGGAAHNRVGRVHREAGRLDEALRHLGTGLALFDAAEDQRGVASSLDDIGKVHWIRGEYDLALRQMRDALTIRRTLGDLRSIALSLNNLGLVYQDSGEFMEAMEAMTESLALRRDIHDLPGQVASLNNLGTVCQDNGDNERAIELWQEALRTARKIDDRVRQAYLLINIGVAQYQLEWFDDAIQRLSQAEEIAAQLRDRRVMGESSRALAKTYMLKGDVAKARAYAAQALEHFELLRSKVHLGVALRTMGEVTAAGGWGEGELEQAREYFRRSILLFEEVGNELELARSCRAYAELLDQAGRSEESEPFRARANEIFGCLRRSSQMSRGELFFASSVPAVPGQDKPKK